MKQRPRVGALCFQHRIDGSLVLNFHQKRLPTVLNQFGGRWTTDNFDAGFRVDLDQSETVGIQNFLDFAHHFTAWRPLLQCLKSARVGAGKNTAQAREGFIQPDSLGEQRLRVRVQNFG